MGFVSKIYTDYITLRLSRCAIKENGKKIKNDAHDAIKYSPSRFKA